MSVTRAVRRRLRCKSLDPDEAWLPPPALKFHRGARQVFDDAVEEVTIVSCVVVRRRSEIRAEQFGLEHDVYVKMQKMKLPAGLMNINWWLRQTRASSARDLDFVEWFAGVGNVHKAMIEAGYAVCLSDHPPAAETSR